MSYYMLSPIYLSVNASLYVQRASKSMYVQHNMLSGFLGALERNVQIIIFPINTNLVLSSGLSTDLADLPRKKSVKAQEKLPLLQFV